MTKEDRAREIHKTMMAEGWDRKEDFSAYMLRILNEAERIGMLKAAEIARAYQDKKASPLEVAQAIEEKA